MNILHIDCSPRIGSWSRRISALILQEFVNTYHGATVTTRDLGFHPIPHPSSDYAYALSTREAYTQALTTNVLDTSEELIREVETADIIVIGTPMNNFTIPSNLKAWLDQVIRMGRTLGSGPDGKFGLLADRPVYVGIATGDLFQGPGAKQPDHLTPYLTSALGCIGLHSMTVFALQATARTEEEILLQQLNQLQNAISRTICDRPLEAASNA